LWDIHLRSRPVIAARFNHNAPFVVKRAGLLADTVADPSRSSGVQKRVQRDPVRGKGHSKMATKWRQQVPTGHSKAY
jgi:hypothetical protein